MNFQLLFFVYGVLNYVNSQIKQFVLEQKFLGIFAGKNRISMVFSTYVSFCWSLTFLTKTAVSLKICTRGDHACCFTSTFYTYYIFVYWLFNKSLLIKSCCQYSRTYMRDHLPYATTQRIRQNTVTFPSQIPIIRTSQKRLRPLFGLKTIFLSIVFNIL